MNRISILIAIVVFGFTSFSQINFKSKFSGAAKPGSKGEIEITINKKSINSFAKYQMEFPNGVNIAEIDSKGGNFSIEGNKAKIVWINLPVEETFSIRLKILFNATANFPITLYQKFYYLENSVKKEVQGESLIINTTSETQVVSINKNSPSEELQISKNTTENQQTEHSDKKTETTKTSSNNQEFTDKSLNKENSKPKEEKQNKEDNLTNSGIKYRIQIAASAVKPAENSFSNAGEIKIVQHNGMYKVITKKEFASKEEALQYREHLIQKGYSGSFLVKYQNGKRIN